jgi:HEAT repeat protein
VADGRVVVDGAGFADRAEAVWFAVSLAEALRPPADLVPRLLENLHSCGTTWERLAILRLLADRFADHPVARQALEKALTDPNEEACLVAATALGDEGADTLARIVGHLGQDETRPARALRALGERLSTQQLMDLLAQALRSRRHIVAEAVIELLAPRQDEPVTGRLTAVLAHGNEGLGLAAARAIAAHGDGAAEPALVTALASGWSSVRVAAAEALGAVGGASAVAPLRAAAEGGDRGVRDATLLAIARIQSRLPDADFGQLSLADARAGDVSPADEAPRGQVSLARDD